MTYINELNDSIRLLRMALANAEIRASMEGTMKLVTSRAEVRDELLRKVSNRLTAYGEADGDLIEKAFAYSVIVDAVKKARKSFGKAVAMHRKAVAETEARLIKAARKGDYHGLFTEAQALQDLMKELKSFF